MLTALLLVSLVLVAGCVGREAETNAVTGGAETGATGSMTEDQAFNKIEEEMNEAVENIDMGDLEGYIPE